MSSVKNNISTSDLRKEILFQQSEAIYYLENYLLACKEAALNLKKYREHASLAHEYNKKFNR